MGTINKTALENGEPTYYARRDELLSVVDSVNRYITDGTSGYSGGSGYSGYSGISGYSGYSGPSGYSGYSGISGYSGVDSNWQRSAPVLSPVNSADTIHIPGGDLQVTGSIYASSNVKAAGYYAGGYSGIPTVKFQYMSASVALQMEFTGGLLTYQGAIR